MKLKDVYLGSESCYVGQSTGFGHRRWSADKPRAFVLGVQFGPMLLCVGCSAEEALDEWDERQGRRVDIESDASTLADYGTNTEEAINAAIDCGDIRINSGGTMVWVDPHEWMRGFVTVKEAGEFFRGGWNG